MHGRVESEENPTKSTSHHDMSTTELTSYHTCYTIYGIQIHKETKCNKLCSLCVVRAHHHQLPVGFFNLVHFFHCQVDNGGVVGAGDADDDEVGINTAIDTDRVKLPLTRYYELPHDNVMPYVLMEDQRDNHCSRRDSYKIRRASIMSYN
jgi:hypothetical protein